MTRTALCAACALVLSWTGTARASDEDKLSVIDGTGTVVASFTQTEAEDRFGLREIVTSTPWTSRKIRFSGIDGETLLKAAGVSGETVTAIALDDYAATLTWDDIVAHDVIFATRMNGKPLTIANKGPFWIMFDFDAASEREMAELLSKSVWHMVEIEVE